MRDAVAGIEHDPGGATRGIQRQDGLDGHVPEKEGEREGERKREGEDRGTSKYQVCNVWNFITDG